MAPGPRVKWLAPVSWEDVTTLNARLCEARGALHRPTSDGHDATRDLWERSRQMDLSLEEAIIVCHRCHRLAPFCFFNGNTFVAIARGIINPVLERLTLRDPVRAAAFRSVVGHFVAGTEGLQELRAALREAVD
jgi:hypothetical protein